MLMEEFGYNKVLEEEVSIGELFIIMLFRHMCFMGHLVKQVWLFLMHLLDCGCRKGIRDWVKHGKYNSIDNLIKYLQ